MPLAPSHEAEFRCFLNHVLEDPSMPEECTYLKAQIADGLRKRFEKPPLAAMEQSLRRNLTVEKVRAS